MTLQITVDERMHLRREGGNLIVRKQRSELVIPDPADVEFLVNEALVGGGDVPVTKVKAVPVSSGNSCFACGGMTVRTGSCETCTTCGTSGGCG